MSWSPSLPNLLRGKRGEGDALSACQKIVADEAAATLLDADDKVYVFHSWLAVHFPRTLLHMVSHDTHVVCFTFCHTFTAGSLKQELLQAQGVAEPESRTIMMDQV